MKTKMRFGMYLLSMVLAIFFMAQSSLATTFYLPNSPDHNYTKGKMLKISDTSILVYGNDFYGNAHVTRVDKVGDNWSVVWDKSYYESGLDIGFKWIGLGQGGDFVAVGDAVPFSNIPVPRVWTIPADGGNGGGTNIGLATVIYDGVGINGYLHHGAIRDNQLYINGERTNQGWLYIQFDLSTNTLVSRRVYAGSSDVIGLRVLLHPDVNDRVYLGGNVVNLYNTTRQKDGYVISINPTSNTGIDFEPLATEWETLIEDIDGFSPGYNERLRAMSVSPNGIGVTGWTHANNDLWFAELGFDGEFNIDSNNQPIKKLIHPTASPGVENESPGDMVPFMSNGTQVGHAIAVQKGYVNDNEDGMTLFIDLEGNEIDSSVEGLVGIGDDFRSVAQLSDSSFIFSGVHRVSPYYQFQVAEVDAPVIQTEYIITATAGANGTITPPGSVTVLEGNNQTFDIAADSGYYINDVLVDGMSQGAITSYTFSNVQSDHTISASFVEDSQTYTLTVNEVGPGTVTKNPNQINYSAGDVVVLTAIPGSQSLFLEYRDVATNQVLGDDLELPVTISGDTEINAIFVSDYDSDGISDADEQPPGKPDYDGNGDNIPDWQQADVITTYMPLKSCWITFEYPVGNLSNIVFDTVPSGAPTDLVFNYGMISFDLNNIPFSGSASVKVIFPEGFVAEKYYKYNSTALPGDEWEELNYDGATGAVINDNEITLYFVDGGRGDSGPADGMIKDPGGPATVVSSSTPPPSGGGGGSGGCFISTLF